jgi:hypothetical protein
MAVLEIGNITESCPNNQVMLRETKFPCSIDI